MINYLPSIMLQWLRKYCIGEHESEKPVSAYDKGIYIIEEDQKSLYPGYIYIGTPKTIKRALEADTESKEQLCMISAGKCNFSNASDLFRRVFLIETSLDLVPLYNKASDCYRRYGIESNRITSITVNEPFQKLITDILDSKMTDPDEINDYLSENNLDPSKYFRTMAVRFSNANNSGSIGWNFIISTLEQQYPTAYLAVYGQSIVIIDRHSKRNNIVNEDVIMPLLEQYDASMGIGNIARHIESLPAVYSQLQAAIKFGRNIDPQKRIYYTEEYAMYQVVEMAIESATRLMHTRNPVHLMNNEAVSLMEHDTREKDDLLHVLDVYLQNNCNSKKTAEDLFIHRNTMYNKLEKIESVIKRPLDDPVLQERLRFSCTVYRYITGYLHENPLVLKTNMEMNEPVSTAF